MPPTGQSQQAMEKGENILKKIEAKLNNILYGDNKFSEIMSKIEEATGMKRVTLLAIVVAVIVLGILLLLGVNLVGIFFAVVYPAVKSVQAMDENNQNEKDLWLAFWIVNAALYFAIYFLNTLFFWIPGLGWVEMGVRVWLVAPEPYNGAWIIYQRVIMPRVNQFGPHMQQSIQSFLGGRASSSMQMAQPEAYKKSEGGAGQQQKESSSQQVKSDSQQKVE